MIKKREINRLFYLSRKLLKKRPNLNNLGNNFLFLPTAHPFQLSKYKFVDSKNIVKNFHDLYNILQNKKYSNKRNSIEYTNFVNNYYRPVNHKKFKNIF